MSRRTIAIAAALSVLALGSPLITANANPLARQYYDQGFDKYDAGNYQGATDDYTKTIEIDPQYELFYTLRVSAREKTNDLVGACLDWRKAKDLGLELPAGYLESVC